MFCCTLPQQQSNKLQRGPPLAHLEHHQQRVHRLFQLLRRGPGLATVGQRGSRRGAVLRQCLPHAVHRSIGAAAKLAQLTPAALQRRQLRLQGLQEAQATRSIKEQCVSLAMNKSRV